jgi:MSHA biogenesis protein MshO
MRPNRKYQHGFTLVEMIAVIVIMGIIVAAIAIFLRAPVEGYMNSASRAEMTDIADTALRRIGRDLRSAVPNSVRLPAPAGSQYIEFLPTRDGGRYRATPAGGAGGCTGVPGNTKADALSFSTADTCFEIVGLAIPLVRGASDDASDQIVIGSTQSSGNPPYDKTTAGVRRPYTGATGSPTAIRITNVQFPAYAQLPGQRFDVVPFDQQAVTYSCENVGTNANKDGTGILRRYWGYGYNVAQLAPPLGNSAILASNVSACNIVYDTYNVRSGLVAITLGITRGGESIRLYHEIHVNNIP